MDNLQRLVGTGLLLILLAIILLSVGIHLIVEYNKHPDDIKNIIDQVGGIICIALGSIAAIVGGGIIFTLLSIFGVSTTWELLKSTLLSIVGVSTNWEVLRN